MKELKDLSSFSKVKKYFDIAYNNYDGYNLKTKANIINIYLKTLLKDSKNVSKALKEKEGLSILKECSNVIWTSYMLIIALAPFTKKEDFYMRLFLDTVKDELNVKRREHKNISIANIEKNVASIESSTIKSISKHLPRYLRDLKEYSKIEDPLPFNILRASKSIQTLRSTINKYINCLDDVIKSSENNLLFSNEVVLSIDKDTNYFEKVFNELAKSNFSKVVNFNLPKDNNNNIITEPAIALGLYKEPEIINAFLQKD